MRDLNAEHSDTAARKYAYGFDYRMHGFILRTFAPYLAKKLPLALELGCYKGAFTKLLCERFYNVTVIEGSSDLIDEARKNAGHQVQFIHSRFEEAELIGKFDAIFLIHTLEHLDDPRPVLERCKGWLSPTGRLFVVVPNGNAASRQIAVGMGLLGHNAEVTDGEWDHGHRRTYVLDTLERDVRAAKLEVEARGGIFFKPLANFQLDRALQDGLIDEAYLDGCYQLGQRYPDLCSSIYVVCR